MTLTYKIILVCIILYLIYRNSFKELFTDYYKCDKYRLNKPLQNLISTHKINKNNDINKSQLYIPCTYTTSELELAENKFNKEQSIFAVAGCDAIVSKNYLWYILVSNIGRDEASKLMPETFLIDDKNDMDLFISKYKKNKLYILKKNLQRKQGLLLTKDLKTILDSKKNDYKVIQEYIPDVMTINNRKLNIRLYFVIICYKDNFACYLYNEGKCIYTNKDYDYNSEDMQSHFTSLELEYSIYENNPLTISELKDYMDKNNMDSNKLWLKILHNMKNLTNCIKNNLCNKNELNNNLMFQIFGPDYVVDSNFNPFLLEINKGPAMNYNLDKEKNIKNNLYIDTLALVKYFCKINNINKEINSISGHSSNFTKIYQK